MSAFSSVSIGSKEGQASANQSEPMCKKRKLYCGICFEPSTDFYIQAVCSHIFCRACLANSMSRSDVEGSCPFCREKFQRSDLKHDSEKNSTICELWNKCAKTPPLQSQAPQYGYTPSSQSSPAPETIRLPYGGFKEEGRVIESINVGKEIVIKKCKVLNKTKSNFSEIKAIECELEKIVASQEVSLKDTTFSTIQSKFSSVTCHQTDLNAAAPQGRSIKAYLNVDLRNINLAESVKSKFGSVKAENCLLDSVKATYAIWFKHSSATTVTSKSGGILASGSAENKSQFGSLTALGTIKISHSTVAGDVESGSPVEARDSLVLGRVISTTELRLERSQVRTATIIDEQIGQPTLYLDAASKIEGDLIVKMEEGKASASAALPNRTLIIVGGGEIGGSIKFVGCKGTILRK